MSSSPRETWKNKADFTVALISYGVGLGNVWRFPYLAYSSGGGAFLIPFLVSSIVVGIPFALLEVALGQWMREGGIGAWDITPLLKGIGFANLLIVFLGNVYYEVILAWTMRYIIGSLNTVLPWTSCGNWWNTKCCSTSTLKAMNNLSEEVINRTMDEPIRVHLSLNTSFSTCEKLKDPITEYWERNVLGISEGIEHPGGIKFDLLMTLLASWLIVYLSIFRGMKNSRVVVYITAIMPYIFLAVLLVRGCMLPGALNGISYYLYPNWTRLTDFQVWSDAGTQIFYSYGIGIAALVSLGSFNKFHHNSYRDVVIFTIINTFTSILAGFVIFSILGYMAYERGIDIKDVAEEGPGLAFIVYPQALQLLPWSPVWSFIFFVMLFLLGLGTQVVAAEAITTAIMDEYVPKLKIKIKQSHMKALLSAINVILSFVCGLPMITNGGMYVFQIFDTYAASRSLLFIGLFEIIAIAYVYGVNQFVDNLNFMWQTKFGICLKFMWFIATPAFTLVLIIFTIMTYSDLTYNRMYVYPQWALSLGWIMACSSLLCIPLYATYRLITTKGNLTKRLKHLTTPVIKPHQHDLMNGLPHKVPQDLNLDIVSEKNFL